MIQIPPIETGFILAAQRFELSGRGYYFQLLATLAHPTPSLVKPPASPVRSSDLLGEQETMKSLADRLPYGLLEAAGMK